jgi:hypothetical protein
VKRRRVFIVSKAGIGFFGPRSLGTEPSGSAEQALNELRSRMSDPLKRVHRTCPSGLQGPWIRCFCAINQLSCPFANNQHRNDDDTDS